MLVTFGGQKNVANPDFENLKHLQNPGHLSLTEPSMWSEKFLERSVRLVKNIILSGTVKMPSENA